MKEPAVVRHDPDRRLDGAAEAPGDAALELMVVDLHIWKIIDLTFLPLHHVKQCLFVRSISRATMTERFGLRLNTGDPISLTARLALEARWRRLRASACLLASCV